MSESSFETGSDGFQSTVTIDVDHMPDAIVIADADSQHIVYANTAAEELFRCDADELVGRHQTELHPAGKTAAYAEAFRRGLGGQRVNRLQSGEPLFIKTSNGDNIPVEINVQRLTVEGSSYLMGVFREVSEQVERERALNQTTTRLETLLDVLPTPVSVLDTDGVVKRWNQAAEEVLGYTAEEVIGKRYSLFTDTDEFETVLMNVADGESLRDYRTTLRASNGAQVPVAVNARPLYESETVTGIIGTAVDLSDRHRREQQLDLLNRMARHNFRNELSVIQGYGEVLERSMSDENDHAGSEDPVLTNPKQDPVSKILAASDRLLELSEEAVNIQKAISNREQMTTQDLSQLISALLEQFRTDESVDELEVEVATGSTSGQVPVAAATATSDLFERLLDCSDNAKIQFRANTVDNYIELSVTGDKPLFCETERTLIQQGAETDLQHNSGLTVPRTYLTIRSLGGIVELEHGTAETPANSLRVELPQAGV